MNDKSEGLYADKVVFGNVPDVSEKSFAQSDHCYIFSLMDESKDDDLTMWRLYGNDAEGVCLNYKLRSDDFKMSPFCDNFFLAKVSYGEIDRKTGRETHKELNLLKKIHRHDFGSGWRFEFRRWGIWKHFFKSYHFKDEKEIRLLYHDKTGDRQPFEWRKNNESQIISKMQLFGVEDFPLALSGIKVGPKVAESKLVKRQLQLLADSQDVRVRVDASAIVIYR